MQLFKTLFAVAVLVLSMSAFTNPTNSGDETTTTKVDPTASQIIWKGYKVTGEHAGTINIKEGALDYKDGVLVGGNFTIDMNSIACTDLTGEYAQKLEGHLKVQIFLEQRSFQRRNWF